MSYNDNGANFVIKKIGEAPTISSTKYIFFGKMSAVIRSAPGSGIVSSFILLSDDLDEIDLEWIGDADSTVQSNFFGKGNTTVYDRSAIHQVTKPVEEWHTYTIDWTSSSIKWYIDNNLVRTVNYGDADALGGKGYPQTPMRVKIGSWIGCPSQEAASNPKTSGTCGWAGGAADWSKEPFTMLVKSVTVEDYSCANEYVYGDLSGSYQSIKSIGTCGGSTTPSVSGPPSKTTASTSKSATAASDSAESTKSGSDHAESNTSTSSTSTENTRGGSNHAQSITQADSATTPTSTITSTITPTSTISIVDAATTYSSSWSDGDSTKTDTATLSGTDGTITTSPTPSYTTYPGGLVTTVPYDMGNSSTITGSGSITISSNPSGYLGGSIPSGPTTFSTSAIATSNSNGPSSATSAPSISPSIHPGAASNLRVSGTWAFDLLALCFSAAFFIL
jgi:beta-glucanase (GH16 family)